MIYTVHSSLRVIRVLQAQSSRSLQLAAAARSFPTMLSPQHWFCLGAFGLMLASAWAGAARAPVTLPELELGGGRHLKKVEVRSYDAIADRFTLVEGRNVMVVASVEIPSSLREKLKGQVPRKDSAVAPAPKSEPGAAAPEAKTPSAGAAPAKPAKAVEPASTPAAPTPGAGKTDQEKILEYQELILARCKKYYEEEYPRGSATTAVKPVEFHLDTVERVAGWSGRYRWQGRVMVEIAEGNAGRRETDHYEVVTEEKPGEAPRVIDYFRK